MNWSGTLVTLSVDKNSNLPGLKSLNLKNRLIVRSHHLFARVLVPLQHYQSSDVMKTWAKGRQVGVVQNVRNIQFRCTNLINKVIITIRDTRKF